MAKRSQKAASKLEAEQQKKKKGCTRRDIMLGFWIGLAGAAIYVNVKQKPVPKPASSEAKDTTTRSLDVITDPPQSGFSAIPPAATETDPPVQATDPPVQATDPPVQATVPPAITGIPATSGAGTGTQRNFLEIAQRTGTDKVWGAAKLPGCLQNNASCDHPHEVNPQCRVLQGHFYHTMYQKWLGPYSTDDTQPFQFLEIGHYNGKGYEAYKEFLPKAETHSIEIACLPPGPRNEGKWPFGNFAAKNPRYQEFLDSGELHCGDGADYDFLQETWTTKMKRADAPPLKVVIDDAAHIAEHMVKSLLFWFPKIEPGGILVVEDIQPIRDANPFRLHVVSQVLKDLHYCGDPKWQDRMCFPTIQPLLQSVHCELHICVFERNQMPSIEYGREEFNPPPNALDGLDCLLHATPV